MMMKLAFHSLTVALLTMQKATVYLKADKFAWRNKKSTILHSTPINDFTSLRSLQITGEEDGVCVPNPASCACEDNYGDYRGSINVTENGKTCKVWSDIPYNVHEEYDSTSLSSENTNYCRSSNSWVSRTWCFTQYKNGIVNRNFCDVPKCRIDMNYRQWWKNEPMYTLGWYNSPDVHALSFSPDGELLASGSGDNTIKIWSIETRTLVRTLSGHKGPVRSIHFSPDGRQIASGSSDTLLKIWNVTSGEIIATHRGHGGNVRSVQFSQTGALVASGQDNKIKVWETIGGIKPILNLTGHTNFVNSICFSPNGRQLASASDDKTVKLWDLDRGSLIRTFIGHDREVYSVDFNPDGTQLASGSIDKTIHVWKLSSAEAIKILSTQSFVYSIKFSPSGDHIVAGCHSYLMIWNIDRSERVLESTIDAPSLSVDYSPDGLTVASASHNYIDLWAQTCRTVYGKPPNTKCKMCNPGFQAQDRGTLCEPCATGGYCPGLKPTDLEDNGFRPCPKGTYNNLMGKTYCKHCPAGTFSNSEYGNVECLDCPYRLDSEPNSPQCTFCAKGFYLAFDPGIEELKRHPDQYCRLCPENTVCDAANTTLKTLKGNDGFWRDSDDTATFFKCNINPTLCRDNSCLEGYGGVLCQVCDRKDFFFNRLNGLCQACPSTSARLGALLGALIALLVISSLSLASDSCPRWKFFFSKISVVLTSARFQAKIKILIVFYQIVANLETIYGVKMHSAFTSWFNVLTFFQFDIVGLIGVPESCFGSMTNRLLLNACWPFVVVALFAGGQFLQIFFSDLRIIFFNGQGPMTKGVCNRVWSRTVNFAMIIIFFSLPSVCEKIFDAKKCISFITNDQSKEMSSYLVADLSVKCDVESTEYQAAKWFFWFLFIWWPVAAPLAILLFLFHVQKELKSYSVTGLADASRFLLAGYDRRKVMWEFVDLTRRIFLSSFILFVDTEEGSNRITRLLLATTVCVMYGFLLARVQPYKNKDDLDLAVLSNFFLTVCFLLGIIIHQCKEDEELQVEGGNKCMAMFGISDSKKATLITLVLIIAILLIFITMVTMFAKEELSSPSVRLVSTGSTPNMDLPKNHKFHMFVSHVWKTGQDKTHNFVRMLELYLKGVNIWLDVDVLEKVSGLEDSVGEAACFVLFYTSGYFRSVNCRRECAAAVKQGKSFIVIHTDNQKSVDDFKEECMVNFPEGQAHQILHHALAEEPILWLGGSSSPFAMCSIKIVALRLLHCFPYYKHNPSELDRGLKIENELRAPRTSCVRNIVFYTKNEGILPVVNDFESMVGNDINFVAIHPFDAYLLPASNVNHDVMLLYLNKDTFSNPNGRLKYIVELFLKGKSKIIMVHEQDIDRGHVTFEQIIRQTHGTLRARGLFDDIAIPLYSKPEYRDVSLKLILKKLRDDASY